MIFLIIIGKNFSLFYTIDKSYPWNKQYLSLMNSSTSTVEERLKQGFDKKHY